MSAKQFLDVGMSDGGFFSGNRLVKVCLSLDNFAISSDTEKATFLRCDRSNALTPHAYGIAGH